MYSLMIARGAPPQDAANYDVDQECPPHRYLRTGRPWAVELAEFGAEVRADLPHDLLAAGQDLPGERAAPVRRREDQVCVEAVDNGPFPSYIGVSFPAW